MSPRRSTIALFWALAIALSGGDVFAQSSGAAAGLKVLVLAGEDSVNVIQQRTAVAPIVEVRDKNDQPVAGALVAFSIGGRSKFANGQKAMTVTTDATGRAAAGQVVPVDSGRAPISVRASYQGQTASASIRQVNVLTAAQAATVAATGGAAAAGGGGVSPLMIGVIAGGGAGAAVIGVRAASGDDAATSQPPSILPAVPTTFTGPLSEVTTFTVTPPGCQVTATFTGTLSITVQAQTATTISGVGSFERTLSNPSPPCGGFTATPGTATFTLGSFSGPPNSIQMNVSSTGSNGTSSAVNIQSFTGQLVGSVVSGTLTYSVTTTFPNGPVIVSATTVPVTLR